MKAAGIAKFPRHLADGHHHVPSAIPRTAVVRIETVSARTCVGEGRVYITIAVDAQIAASSLPGKLSGVQIRVAATLNQKATSRQAFDLGQYLHLVIGIDKIAQRWRLVPTRHSRNSCTSPSTSRTG